MKDPEFGAFIKRERQRLVGFVRALLRDASEIDAEDVVHDVLVRLLGKPNLELPLDRMSAYVYRSLQNRVVDHFRSRGRHVSLDEETEDARGGLIDVLQDVKPDALEILQSEQGRQGLFEGLDSLSPIEREVVIAHELEGVSFKELASRWNMPVNTLLSHKARGMKKLKIHFQASREHL